MDLITCECSKTLIGISVAIGLIVYYLVEAVQRPRLACRPGEWKSFLEAHLTLLHERYWPTPWCFESRCQTILASVLKSRIPNVTYKREVLELSDGGAVCLDWLEDLTENRNEKDQPIVIFLPGLTGCSQSEYVKSFVLAAHNIGAKCVVFNNRGRGGIELKTARTYCAANSDDLEEALHHIRKQFPSTRIMATGISLGGMILGNYLATRGEDAARHLNAAMVLSIPWNVFVGTESLERPLWNLLLNRHLANCLCESVNNMRKQLEGKHHKWDLDHVMQSKTIREFDSRFTAVQFGFRDVDEYYESACLHDKLDNIKVPLLCLSAADDPFQPIEGIPIDAANASSHVAIVITARGGHIGFLEGLLPSTIYYSDRLYAQLVAAIFNNPDSFLEVHKEAEKFAQQPKLPQERTLSHE